jgi:hypothetical protein
MTKKILILAANPGDTDRLRLDKEVSEIKKGLRGARHREQFDIRSEWAISFDDLRRALLDNEPQIVHFSGHGDVDGLILEGELGIGEPISSEALSELFNLCSDHVECVILNACYSASQAAAINKYINYVIGMPKKIIDKAAIKFSVGFYDALGAGKTVEVAFKFGCLAFRQLNIPKEFDPRLYKKKSAHFPREEKSDSKTKQTNSPTPLNTPPSESQKAASQIINIGNAGKINITDKGDIINNETNYNYPTDPKKEK